MLSSNNAHQPMGCVGCHLLESKNLGSRNRCKELGPCGVPAQPQPRSDPEVSRVGTNEFPNELGPTLSNP